jgi:hypothetical protein
MKQRYLDFPPGTRFAHPASGEPAPIYDTRDRTWRHLNFFQYECHLHAWVPRVEGAVCEYSGRSLRHDGLAGSRVLSPAQSLLSGCRNATGKPERRDARVSGALHQSFQSPAEPEKDSSPLPFPCIPSFPWVIKSQHQPPSYIHRVH